MKTISTLFASLLLTASVFAADARKSSIITVISADQNDIRVVLDGKQYNPNDNTVRIEQLTDGYHTIQVSRERNAGIFSRNRRFDIVYNTSINLKKRTNLFIKIEKNGRVSMEENKISKDYQYDQSGGQWGGNNQSDDQWGGYDQSNGYATAMNARDFDRVLESIDREWLESNKLKSATQVVTSSSLSSAQVKQLVQLFTFENNKLELAKQAYANTVDKRNYYLVADVFSFNANKVELERYIQRYR